MKMYRTNKINIYIRCFEIHKYIKIFFSDQRPLFTFLHTLQYMYIEILHSCEQLMTFGMNDISIFVRNCYATSSKGIHFSHKSKSISAKTKQFYNFYKKSYLLLFNLFDFCVYITHANNKNFSISYL